MTMGSLMKKDIVPCVSFTNPFGFLSVNICDTPKSAILTKPCEFNKILSNLISPII